MKLGNRKAVVTGLTAMAITSVSALSGITTEAAATNHINATPVVLCQSTLDYNVAAAGLNISSLYMPGQLSDAVYSISKDEDEKEIIIKAGIARIFSQNSTSVENLKVTITPKPVQAVASSESEQTVANDEAQKASFQEAVESDEEALQQEMSDMEDNGNSDENAGMSLQTAGVATVLDEAVNEEANMTDSAVETTKADSEAEEALTGSAIDIESNTEEEKEEESKEASEWSDRVMANVEKSVNIREAASEEAAVVGKLYKGAAAYILEKGDEWTKISSGSIEEGYVKNEYLAFGEEAAEIAQRDGATVATVETDALRLRSEASEDAAILDLAENGEELTVVSESDGWVEVEYTGSETAYVSSDYVSVDFVLGEAITIEEEKAIEAEKARKEAEARMREIENSEDAALLAALVKMEAGGECYEGKLAVASVVVNRVRSGAYPSTVSGVIYQSGQFPGAANGTLAACMGAGGDCKKAAVEALAGISNVGNLKHFNSVSKIGTGGLVIGNHCFY